MGQVIMLTPNPFKPGSIARVVVINSDAVAPLVVDIDPLFQNPQMLRALNPGFVFAVRFWSVVTSILFFGSIGLSFFWHWWAFLGGILAAYLVQRFNRRSVADFVLESVIEQKDVAIAFFKTQNLLWVASPNKLTRDST